MSSIVTSTYRYRRPPKKRKAVALEVPAIVRFWAMGRRFQMGYGPAAVRHPLYGS